jgi:hypothetical protein
MAGAPTFTIPAGVLAQHVIALGKTGAGKSSAMRVLVERLLDADKPVCIIDPKGDWYGLKSSADGKKAGYPVVIFGGEHADVPINEHAGAHVAELIATGNRSCLIDLGGWMVGERTRFFIGFASTLFKHTRGARHLFIDEVHNFAPQGKVMNPDAGAMLHWANRLASEGRGKGLTIIAASQRPQKVHKDFVTSCETLIAMRVIHKLDRDAIKDWIDGCADPAKGKEVLATLAQMKRGEAWVWSPEIEYGPERIGFPMFKTYDSFKPQAADVGKLTGWAAVDLEEVKTKLAQVVDEAHANDPAILKRRIAELERQAASVAAPAKVDTAALERRSYEAGFSAGFDRAVGATRGAVRSATAELRSALDRAQESAEAFLQGVSTLKGEVPQAPVQPQAWRPPAPARPIEKRVPRPENGHDVRSGVEQRILDALAELEQMGATQPERELIAFMAGYSHVNSKGFANAIGALRSQGLIEGTRLTPVGRTAAHPPARPRTAAELQERIIGMLGGASARVLRPLIEAYPGALERQALAESAGYGHVNSKGFANAIGRFRTLGFIDYPDRGTVVAKPLLFLE